MKKTTKIITLILSAVLLIGAAIGISVSAEENTPTVSIAYKNIAYEGAVKVLYAVEAQNVPEGAKVQMAFFDTMPESVEETPTYLKDEYEETIEIGGVTYKVFFSEGIAPKNMRKNIYAVPVITKDGEVIAFGDPAAYSIYNYAINMFAKAPTEDQKELYSALLDYGASVQELLLGTADYTAEDLEAAGGYADQYCGVKFNTLVNSTALTEHDTVTYYRPGDNITYTADLYKDGASFTGYTDENRKLIGIYGTELDCKATKPGISVITANYYTFETDLMDKTGIYGVNNFSKGGGTFTTDVTTGANGEEITNNVVKFTHTASTALDGASFAYYTSAEAYVFETDVKWLGSTVDRTSDNWIMRWGFVSTGTNGLSNADKYLYCNYATSKLDSPLYINGSAGYSGSAPSTSYATFPIGEWHRIRIEYVPLGNANGTYTGIQRIYFDGTLTNEMPVTAKGDNSDCLTFLVSMRGKYDTQAWGAMFDNAVCYSIKEDYYGKGLYANDPDVNKYDGTNANHSGGTIVTEANGNKVVQYNKKTGKGLTMAFNADGIEYGDTYVFDTDIKWLSMPYADYGRNWIGRMGLVSDATKNNGEDATFISRHYFGATPTQGMVLSESADSTYGAAVIKKPRFTPGVWCNLRVEFTYTGVNADGKYTGVEKMYFNNELVSTVNVATASDVRGLVAYRFATLSLNSWSVQFDNTFIGVVGEPVYADTNFEAGATSGTYFTPSSTDGDAVSEYTVVDNPKETTVAGAAGKVLKADLTTGTNQEVNTIKIMNSTNATAVGTYELSFDMLFDSTTLPTNTVIQQLVVHTTSGYAALFSLYHRGDGMVEVTSDVNGSDPGKYGILGKTLMLDGEWHNLRFVMYKNGADSVYALYVDGELSGIGNYYHNPTTCVNNSTVITSVSHRIKVFAPTDTAVTSAALYFDNIALVYTGDIPADIPDWDAD